MCSVLSVKQRSNVGYNNGEFPFSSWRWAESCQSLLCHNERCKMELFSLWRQKWGRIQIIPFHVYQLHLLVCCLFIWMQFLFFFILFIKGFNLLDINKARWCTVCTVVCKMLINSVIRAGITVNKKKKKKEKKMSEWEFEQLNYLDYFVNKNKSC